MAASGKTRPGVTKARLAYLYGVNGGPPVVNTKELAAIGGVCENTIWKHTVAWKKEAEEIAVKLSVGENRPPLRSESLSLSIDEQVCTKHKARIAVLDSELDSLQAELENLEPTMKEMYTFLRKFDEDDKEHALRIFENYLRASANKQNLRKQFLALHSQWAKMAGIDAIMDIQVTRAKTVATLQAKAEVNEDKDDEIASESGLAFKRKV